MAILAIKGHATRGREVIELLEMLGGINKYEITTAKVDLLYAIRCHDKFIIGVYPTDTFIVFTLEEFLEEFPYKVGDKVLYYGNPVFITQMEWIEDSVSYHFYYKGRELMLPVKHLQPYKEEIMGKANKAVFDASAQCCDIMNHLIKEKAMEEIKIDIPKGYEFAGVDDDNQQVVFTKIGYQFPKTHEECCDILGISYMQLGVVGYACEKLHYLQELLLYRDAYWKIAGEQMGLGKPWEPDWKNSEEKRYCIVNIEGDINLPEKTLTKWILKVTNKILVFPTEEMRDAFYENFKELIEQCRELL